MEIIGKYFKMNKEEILLSREKRKIAICLIKENTEITNRQIGEVFGGISYSAVSKIYERYKNDMQKNKKIRKQIDQIKRIMSNVKG